MIYTWEVIVFLSYGIPLWLLYIFILIQLVSHQEFKQPFFRLAFILGILDLSFNTIQWVETKLPWWPGTGKAFYTTELKFFFLITHFLLYYLPKCRDLFILASAINRFTAISKPHTQKEFWSRWLWIIIAFNFTLPFFLTFQILTGTVSVFPFYGPKSDIDSYVIDVKVPWYTVEKSILNVGYTFIVTMLSMISNSVTLYYLIKLRKSVTSQVTGNIEKINKAEVNLFFVSIWDLSMGLLFTAHQIAIFTFDIRGDVFNPWFDRLLLWSPWLGDVITLSRPILLIFMSRQLQIALIKAFQQRRLIASSLDVSKSTVVTISSGSTF